MSFYSGSLLFPAAASALLGIFVCLQGRRKLPNITLALLAVSIGAWCFGQFMGEMTGAKEAVLFWTRANLAAAVLIPVFYLHFVLAFTKREAGKFLPAAYAAAALLLLSDLTPWFVADVAPRAGYRYYPVPGMVYPLFALYLLLFFGAAFLRLLSFLRRGEGAAG